MPRYEFFRNACEQPYSKTLTAGNSKKAAPRAPNAAVKTSSNG